MPALQQDLGSTRASKSTNLSFLDGIFLVGQSNGMPKGDYKLFKYNLFTNAETNIMQFSVLNECSFAALQGTLFIAGGFSEQLVAFDLVEKRMKYKLSNNLDGRSRFGLAYSSIEIIVCGGRDNECSNPLTSCELFQLASNRWIEMPDMLKERSNFRVVWMKDGRIFTIGGYYGYNSVNAVEMLYHEWSLDTQSTDSWRQCNGMLKARSDFAAVVLHEEVVIVAGGWNAMWNYIDSVELFSPPAVDDSRALGQWTSLRPMQSTPQSACSGAFSDGVLFIFEEDSSKIRRFRLPPRRFDFYFFTQRPTASPEYTNWRWDEDLSLTTANHKIQSLIFR